jgi:hypothetical protein
MIGCYAEFFALIMRFKKAVIRGQLRINKKKQKKTKLAVDMLSKQRYKSSTQMLYEIV